MIEVQNTAAGNPHSFVYYLRDHARISDDPLGDFVSDARDEIAKGSLTGELLRSSE